MKIIGKLLLVLSVLFCVTACTKKTPEPAKYDIGGKTYWNTVDEYPQPEHSHVWFGKDGSFVLNDNFFDGTLELSGTWKLSENVITLTVEHGGQWEGKTIRFEADEKDTLTLRNNLNGCRENDVFTTEKKTSETASASPTPTPKPAATITTGPKPSTASPTPTPKPAAVMPGVSSGSSAKPSVTGPSGTTNTALPKVEQTYYNATHINGYNNETSFLELHADGTFRFVEVQGLGATELAVGHYSSEGNVYMFSDFTPFTDLNGSTVYNFEFMQEADGSLTLNEDMAPSRKGDLFIKDKNKLPKETISGTMTHTAIQDVQTEYLPKIVFSDNGTWIFYENIYSAIAHFSGTYTMSNGLITCDITENSMMYNVAGGELTCFHLAQFNAVTWELLEDVCMSRAGDFFLMP